MSTSSQWQLLQNAFLQNRLSHAYLLSGAAGLKKTQFARQFAAFLLCECSPRDRAVSCGQCRSCLWMQAESHPDFLLIQPIDKSHTIKIDQIREMTQKTAQTAHAGGYQVIVISPADAMPMMAANALLKTLEEPQGKVIMFLIDNQKSVLPATIVSRCQKIFFSSKHIDLRLHNSDLTLRDQLLKHLDDIQLHRENPIALNPAWLKISLENSIQMLILLCVDISRIQLSVDAKHIINHDVHRQLLKVAEGICVLALQKFIEKLLEKKSMISKNINLNHQLCLEDVFIEFEKCSQMNARS
ncbi:MAG: hypothetical protein A3F13_08500 [Gammaproteobacteria bacterium RIFCSPHIGHO2_12_FULL_40_19]|nr:MAG: hypothetical protein A3F13_08500 [Gammaproteobacteria bacterium RIFCSPHIGHO2_12_FULL_40_19]